MMPQSVVYAPELVGGLGLQHLSAKQGIQQVLHLNKHLQAATTNGKLYTMTIDCYQLMSRISTPVLEDTRPILWLLDGWISCICNFLHTTNSKICLKTPWTPLPQRAYDKCIMDNILRSVPPDKAEMINNVRIYYTSTCYLNSCGACQWGEYSGLLAQALSHTSALNSSMATPAMSATKRLESLENGNSTVIH